MSSQYTDGVHKVGACYRESSITSGNRLRERGFPTREAMIARELTVLTLYPCEGASGIHVQVVCLEWSSRESCIEGADAKSHHVCRHCLNSNGRTKSLIWMYGLGTIGLICIC
jgi:hypothetical protein